MGVHRYAAGTDVSVERSRAEIETLLTKHGATAFFSSTDTVRQLSQVGFRLEGRLFRLDVRKPQPSEAPKKPQPEPYVPEGKGERERHAFQTDARIARNAKAKEEHARRMERWQREHDERAAAWCKAEERRRWRAQLLLVKAKLEMIAMGDTTAEREFMADMLMADGRTVGQIALPQLAELYRTGGSTLQLGPGSEVIEGEVMGRRRPSPP